MNDSIHRRRGAVVLVVCVFVAVAGQASAQTRATFGGAALERHADTLGPATVITTAPADPMTSTTDWRLTKGEQPASVIKFENGQLVPCDPDGTPVAPVTTPSVRNLPQNRFRDREKHLA